MSVDIVTMADCASNYGVFEVPSSSQAGKLYTVSFHGSEGPVFCDCEAFKFAREPRTCKHIEYAYRTGCFYNPQWHDGSAEPKLRPIEYTGVSAFTQGSCPACGGPTMWVKRAV